MAIWRSFLIVLTMIALMDRSEQLLLDVRDYDIFGNRMAVAENDVVVLVRNDLRQFFVGFHMFATSASVTTHFCNISFLKSDDFVESVAIPSHNSSVFAYTGENLNRSSHFMGTVGISSSCVGTFLDRQYFTVRNSLEDYDTYTLSVDSQGHFGYLLGWDSSWIYDLQTFQVAQRDSEHDIWHQAFKPVDFLLLNDDRHAIVVGYSFLANWCFRMAISLIHLQPPANLTLVSNDLLLPNAEPIEENDLNYSPTNSISVSVNDQGQLLVGLPMYNLVLLGVVSGSSPPTVNVTGRSLVWPTGGAFGKSVTWLDDRLFAVTAYSSSVLPWSSSQVLVFDASTSFSSPRPLFVYPNNQQTLNPAAIPPRFPRLYSSGAGNLVVLFNNGHVQLLCNAPPGFRTTTAPLQAGHSLVPFYQCQATTCAPGTSKNWSSIGPCLLCPLGTRNSQESNTTNILCEPCDSNAFCPLGAVTNVPRDPYTRRVSQALTFPESPEATSFDDILLQNMLSLPTSSARCIIVSPFFWTLLTVGIVLLVVALTGLFRLIPRFTRQYLCITRIFKQTDLIGEGELWIGGLLSFSVVVLVGFAYAFSATYLRLYPIESSSDPSLMCDRTMRNAQFSTGFRLTSLHVTEEEIPMFELIDAQMLNLSVHLLNTQISCSDLKITLQSSAIEIPFYGYECTRSALAIVSISLELPIHSLTVIFNVSTSHSIGGLRVCLSGPGRRTDNGIYTLRALDFCEFFGTDNQTIGHSPDIQMMLTKVINKTEPLVHGDRTFFTGLFVPTISQEGISDEFSYRLQGDHVRYLSSSSRLMIDLSETSYFVLNLQEPIVRQSEMTLHTLLFTFAVLELFSFGFLLFKILIIPFIRFLVRQCYAKNRVHIIKELEKPTD